MEENTIAVNTTEAPVTDSAPVETSTVDTSIESSEKTEITDTQEVGVCYKGRTAKDYAGRESSKYVCLGV